MGSTFYTWFCKTILSSVHNGENRFWRWMEKFKRLNWVFINFLLTALWQLIWKRLMIMLRGSPTRLFKASRSLQLNDLPSPFIFTIIVEVMYAILSENDLLVNNIIIYINILLEREAVWIQTPMNRYTRQRRCSDALLITSNAKAWAIYKWHNNLHQQTQSCSAWQSGRKFLHWAEYWDVFS